MITRRELFYTVFWLPFLRWLGPRDPGKYADLLDPRFRQVGMEVIDSTRCLFVGPDGEDSNDGIHPARPLATLNAAFAKARPGDIVVLSPEKWEPGT